MPIRVLIADDNSVVRQGLRTFLEGDRGLKLVG
jgi:DNA-binding NarL/FixJ family response regulator